MKKAEENRSVYEKELKKQLHPYEYYMQYESAAGGVPEGSPLASVLGTVFTVPIVDCALPNPDDIVSEYIVFILKNEKPLGDLCTLLLETAEKSHYPDVIYGDTDYEGLDVFMRPAYSPDTLLSFPYIGTCFAVRTKAYAIAVKHMFMLTSSYVYPSGEEALYDLLLHVTEQPNINVCHIPVIVSRKKEFENIFSNRYYLLSQKAEKRRGYAKLTETVQKNPAPILSVIIPSKDHPDLLANCLMSLSGKVGVPYEIIVVDNGSCRDVVYAERKLFSSYRDAVLGNVDVRFIYDEYEFDFARMCNTGASEAKGKFLLFVNDDVTFTDSEAIANMMRLALRPHAGAVGLKLLYPNGCIQHVGVTDILPGPTHKLSGYPDENVLWFGRNRGVWNVLAVTGACLMTEREKYFLVGGFSDKMKVSYNDTDLCVKLYERGYMNMVLCDQSAIHHESVSRGTDIENDRKYGRLSEERRAFYDAHSFLATHKDPFYHENMDCDTTAYRVNVVPEYTRCDRRSEVKMVRVWPVLAGKKVQSTIESVTLERAISDKCEDAYVISGWCLIPKKDNSSFVRQLILLPKDRCKGVGVEMLPVYREDVQNVFPMAENALLSGFVCRIPISAVDPDKEYRLCFSMKKDGGAHYLTIGDIYEPRTGRISKAR